jgi:hypothetical protein
VGGQELLGLGCAEQGHRSQGLSLEHVLRR